MRICFIGDMNKTFIQNDYEILKKYFEIDITQPPNKKKGWIKYPFIVKNKVKKCDAVFGWFAGWHTAIATHYAKKYGKKSIVVVGGYDVEDMPEINYGAFTNIKEKLPSRYVIDNATLLLPFSEYAAKRLEILKAKSPKKKLDLYCDVYKFHPEGKKEDIVLTVGGVKWNNLKRKGLENFVKSATHLPDVKFILVGKWIDDSINYLRSIAPSNVEFTGFLQEKDLITLYQRAKVYCQLSYQEGFGLALAEAMSCECIPVTTWKGAIPEIVDEIGFRVPYDNINKIAKSIRSALNASDELGKKARNRIKNMFLKDKRENELVKIIKGKAGKDRIK